MEQRGKHLAGVGSAETGREVKAENADNRAKGCSIKIEAWQKYNMLLHIDGISL